MGDVNWNTGNDRRRVQDKQKALDDAKETLERHKRFTEWLIDDLEDGEWESVLRRLDDVENGDLNPREPQSFHWARTRLKDYQRKEEQ